MPVKTVEIPAADLRPGHIAMFGRPARVESIVRGTDALAVEMTSGKPRDTAVVGYAPDQPIAVTARSHAYAQSPERHRDLLAARGVLTQHKALLRPAAGDLAKGMAVDLRGMQNELQSSGHTQEAALLRRLPGLRVQIDPEKGLTLTEQPAGYTRGAAQTWKNLESAARDRGLVMFANPISPPGSMLATYRDARTGEDMGLYSRIDMSTGAARTGRHLYRETATLDTARQRAVLESNLTLMRQQARQNEAARPDLPLAQPPDLQRVVPIETHKSGLTGVAGRSSVTGKFAGVSPSANPDRMTVHLTRGGVQERVSIPLPALEGIPKGTQAGTTLTVAFTPERGVTIRVDREKKQGPSLERAL